MCVWDLRAEAADMSRVPVVPATWVKILPESETFKFWYLVDAAERGRRLVSLHWRRRKKIFIMTTGNGFSRRSTSAS